MDESRRDYTFPSSVTLLASRAKKTRPTDTGTWHHFPCPFCVSRGHGRDKKAHLGVKSTGAFKCYRCDASSRTVHTRIHLVGAEDEGRSTSCYMKPTGLVPSDVTPRPSSSPSTGTLVSEVDPKSVTLRVLKERAAKSWPLLPWGRLSQRGLSIDEGKMDRLIQPYVSLRGETGHVVRRFGGEPKALTMGPPGPATFLSEYPLDPCRDMVVVEGWSDGVAVPFEYQPVFLLGSPTQDAGETLSAHPAPIVLCFDGDRAGRGELKSIGLSLLRKGRTFDVVLLPEGEDPADVGPNNLSKRMTERKLVRKSQDFLALLASIRRDH